MMTEHQVNMILQSALTGCGALITCFIYINSKVKELQVKLNDLKEELKEAKSNRTKTCQFHNSLIEQIVTKEVFDAEMTNIKERLYRIEAKLENKSEL